MRWKKREKRVVRVSLVGLKFERNVPEKCGESSTIAIDNCRSA